MSLLDYMTRGLDSELVEKARKIDSGERIEVYLAEQLEKDALGYITTKQ